MITVTLVAVLALALMPLLSGFLGSHDVQTGMNGMVDFLQRARVQAALTGRAHQVRVQRVSVNGELVLDRSGSSSCCCAGQPDDPFLATNGGVLAVDTFDVKTVAPSLVIKLTDPSEVFGSGRGVCFTPDGRVLDPSTLQPFSSEAFDAGTVVFDLTENQIQYDSGELKQALGASSTELPNRRWRVVLGYNGLARWEARR